MNREERTKVAERFLAWGTVAYLTNAAMWWFIGAQTIASCQVVGDFPCTPEMLHALEVATVVATFALLAVMCLMPKTVAERERDAERRAAKAAAKRPHKRRATPRHKSAATRTSRPARTLALAQGRPRTWNAR